MKKIKRIKLFPNDNLRSQNMANIVREKLLKNNFELVDKDFDLGIAIGGDGSFLRMIKNSNFASDCYYVGVNAGTLGFAQEIDENSLDDFIQILVKEEFQYEVIGVQEIEIHTENNISRKFSLNELVVRDKELNTLHLNVYINDDLLEEYAGDGVLISTSFGSTAYNLSFGGSIVFNTFHTLQITPIAPLNSKSYRSLINSVIVPSNKTIRLIPLRNSKNIIITVDGDNSIYDNAKYIETVIGNKTIKIIRMSDYNFIRKINDKFLK